MNEPTPRRRITDRTPQRRWDDKLLDLILKRQDSQSEDIEELRLELRPLVRLAGEFAAFRREFDEWKTERRDDLHQIRDDDTQILDRIGRIVDRIGRLEERVNANFDRNWREHRTVQQRTEEIARVVEPTFWGKVKDIATVVSLLLVPILAAYVAARGGV